jgi:hypothetical protein
MIIEVNQSGDLDASKTDSVEAPPGPWTVSMGV